MAACGPIFKKLKKRRRPSIFFPFCVWVGNVNPMKTTVTQLILVSFLSSCGGSLTDEQRKEMREKMEMNKIVRVTEVEILEAAFKKGRATIETIEKLRNDSVKIDSLLRMHSGSIRFLEPGAQDARPLEQELMDAYVGDQSGSFQDNVQKLRNGQGDFDSVLYTKPVITKRADKSKQLQGVWNIWLSKKDLVLEAGKNK